MDNQNVNTVPTNGAPAANENGKWVAVDPSSLSFAVDKNAPAGTKFQGADGAMYCVSDTEPKYSSVSSNANNAIPVPSSIVQMPPIVQPIALVPYTSQNQPMLQYDPYSRPVDPDVAPKAPNYIKKPYRGISLACLIIALIGGILLALLSVAYFKANDMRSAFSTSGIDLLIAFLMLCGVKESGGNPINSNYYNAKILPFVQNGQWGATDMLSTVVTIAVPVCVILIVIFSIVLLIKYIVKFAQRKSPRCFSVIAFLNIILCLATIGLLIGMSDAEVKIAEGARGENFWNFFAFNSTIYWGAGLIVALISSIALFVLPFCAKKNAYMVEKVDDARTYILNNN